MQLRRYPRQFRQLAAYVFAGGLTAVAHYGVLIGLVELARIDPVPATLAGFIVGATIPVEAPAAGSAAPPSAHAHGRPRGGPRGPAWR